MNLAAAIDIYANRKLHYRTQFQGIPISIENRKGSIRRGTSPEYGPWETKMQHPYGYIRSTKHIGRDGAELDCFVGPNPLASNAYVIMIKKAPDFKKDDEHKVMLGFNSAEEAKEEMLKHFDNPKFFGSMKTMPMDKFRKWVQERRLEMAAHLGEPQVYDGGYQHIEPENSFHPPSLKKAKRVPVDDPMEKDNEFLDVTKRKEKGTIAMRNRLTKQHADANQRPLSRQLVSGFPSGTIGGFG